MNVLNPLFFCLDPLNYYIVISDYQAHSIRFFSPESNLVHIRARDQQQQQQGMFYEPQG